MQARAEVVTTKIFLFEIKLAKRMRAIDDRFDPFCAGHIAHCFHRSYLASDVHLMRHQDEARAIGYSFFEGGGDLIEVLRREWGIWDQLGLQPSAFLRAGAAWSACADSPE